MTKVASGCCQTVGAGRGVMGEARKVNHGTSPFMFHAGLFPGLPRIFHQFQNIAIRIKKEADSYIFEIAGRTPNPDPFGNQFCIGCIDVLNMERQVIKCAWLAVGGWCIVSPNQLDGCAANVDKNDRNIIPPSRDREAERLGVETFQRCKILCQERNMVRCLELHSKILSDLGGLDTQMVRTHPLQKCRL